MQNAAIKALLLALAKRAQELFEGSEVEEKRQLIKLVLSNLRLTDENIDWDVQKPFDLFLKTTDRKRWRYFVDTICNGQAQFDFTVDVIQRVLVELGIELNICT